MLYGVIMAGGQGTRLWPLSRAKAPKQLHSLASEKSLIQETYDRLLPMVKTPDRIYVSTNPLYAERIKEQLPDVPEENYIIEPFPMNTAAACILATAVLSKRADNPVIFFAYSDPAIKDEARFREIVLAGEKILEDRPNNILTVGINPTKPDTGLGYIQFGKEITENGSEIRAFKVKRFVEKPDLKTAEKYVASFDYLWNSGMFMWHTDYLLKLAEEFMPDTHKTIMGIADAWDTPNRDEILAKEYAKVEKTSIDYGIMEKTKDILVIPGDFGWSDIGSWGTLYELLSDMTDSNVVSRGHHIGHNDTNCLVYAGDKLVATVGLEDVVVIDTPDALLICNRHKSQEVKDLLSKIKEAGEEEYL
ncbi:MAG: mannose-1-phosphate guanylyltransferase [Patescibacteria group bacterium]|jgi:mannose-1-phosphate guanylyltransferase